MQSLPFTRSVLAGLAAFLGFLTPLRPAPADDALFQPADIFELENAADPRISPDGNQIVYLRVIPDIMTDRTSATLWLLESDGSDRRPLTTGSRRDSSPRWSPDGKRLLYVSDQDGKPQLYLRWMDTGSTARLANLTRPPRQVAWSPDGRWIAFAMVVPEKQEPFAPMPGKPQGSEWAAPPKFIDKLLYRADGVGYVEDGYSQLFVLPAEGGTPRQISSGPFHHPSLRGGALSWGAESNSLVFSANLREGGEYDPINTEVYEISIQDREAKALSSRQGPDSSPIVSPDGSQIAYVGFDDRQQWYQVRRLYLMQRDGSAPRALTAELDRDVEDPVWDREGRGVWFSYSDQGDTKVAFVDLEGNIETLSGGVGGTSLGRPYSGGSFTVARDGRYAFTWTDPSHPAEVAVASRGGQPAKRLTGLNDDLLAFRQLGAVEEIRYESSFDQRRIQGWIVKPPGFDAEKKYPLILEIHGGPVANYGPRFSAEMQLYAAAGFVVLYVNPRGSDSYGEEFGNLIHHNYPGQDYDDLISGVDAAIAKGYVDPKRLFITGGSGGGVLSSWAIGKTDRFRAAVVAKPVINWYSWSLTADGYNYYSRYWFPGPPWEHMEHYMKRSPISLVGNVRTPTMVLTGESDFRTPISESEQYYQALKLRKIDAALVRVPDASHSITARPSHLIAKVAHVIKWFQIHDAGAPENPK